MWSKKKQHEWDYMGKAKGGGQLGYCDLCKKYRITKDKVPKIITKNEYERLFEKWE